MNGIAIRLTCVPNSEIVAAVHSLRKSTMAEQAAAALARPNGTSLEDRVTR